tara:strand:- start:68 stop:496 length:429 start_codon:yes stop_codon:yes gene_type:complete
MYFFDEFEIIGGINPNLTGLVFFCWVILYFDQTRKAEVRRGEKVHLHQKMDALLRIRSAAKAYEESGQKIEVKTCFNIAHTVSSENEINWTESINAYIESKKDLVKDSTWRSKYTPVFKNVIKLTKIKINRLKMDLIFANLR